MNIHMDRYPCTVYNLWNRHRYDDDYCESQVRTLQRTLTIEAYTRDEEGCNFIISREPLKLNERQQQQQ